MHAHVWNRHMSHDVTWWHMMSHDVTWCHMVSHDVTWCHIMSHDVTWHHITYHKPFNMLKWMSHALTWCYMMWFLWSNLLDRSKSHSCPSPFTRPDSYLLPPTPTRAGPKPVTQGNVAAHIITEFGLQVCVCVCVCVCVWYYVHHCDLWYAHYIQLLHPALKHSKFDTSEEEQLRMLDPFVRLLSDSLTSHHLKVLCRVRDVGPGSGRGQLA